jgi:hypothetical protein
MSPISCIMLSAVGSSISNVTGCLCPITIDSACQELLLIYKDNMLIAHRRRTMSGRLCKISAKVGGERFKELSVVEYD